MITHVKDLQGPFIVTHHRSGQPSMSKGWWNTPSPWRVKHYLVYGFTQGFSSSLTLQSIYSIYTTAYEFSASGAFSIRANFRFPREKRNWVLTLMSMCKSQWIYLLIVASWPNRWFWLHVVNSSHYEPVKILGFTVFRLTSIHHRLPFLRTASFFSATLSTEIKPFEPCQTLTATDDSTQIESGFLTGRSNHFEHRKRVNLAD